MIGNETTFLHGPSRTKPKLLFLFHKNKRKCRVYKRKKAVFPSNLLSMNGTGFSDIKHVRAVNRI